MTGRALARHPGGRTCGTAAAAFAILAVLLTATTRRTR